MRRIPGGVQRIQVKRIDIPHNRYKDTKTRKKLDFPPIGIQDRYKGYKDTRTGRKSIKNRYECYKNTMTGRKS